MRSEVLRVAAHAKINLTLDIVGRLPDGYHLLESVMQRLALHDLLEFRPLDSSAIRFAADSPDVPAGEDNLVMRAARLLRTETGSDQGADIRLKKRIPVSAGLGGGSTDAAATLLGLNELWGLGLTPDTLSVLASRLGADVPFCLDGRTALARGRGERLSPLPPMPPAGVLLVKPCFGVSTADIYRRYDVGVRERLQKSPAMVDALGSGELRDVAGCLGNDLEQVTLAMYPELGEIKKGLLETGALGTLMAGSGPTVFGLYTSHKDASIAANAFSGFTVIVTETA